MSTSPHPTITAFFKAMQTGAASEAEMMALFADDAVYIEPFSGSPRTHTGKPAIRAAMIDGWRYPLPDMRLTIDRIDVDGATIRAAWTCTSPGLPGGAGRGENLFVLAHGKIQRLETRLLPAR